MAAKYVTLNTLVRVINGKVTEVPPNVLIDLDAVKDRADIEHFIKTKSIQPYDPVDVAPPVFVPPTADVSDPSSSKPTRKPKTEKAGAEGKGDETGQGLV